jgi:hypothetical protein
MEEHMPTITVVKQFMLKDDNHRLTEYLPGTYDVDEAVAEHWYVQAHCEGFVEPPPKVGHEQYAQTALLAAQAARVGESTEAQKQPPAPSAEVSTRAPTRKERRFAGRDVPKEMDPNLATFTDPATL